MSVDLQISFQDTCVWCFDAGLLRERFDLFFRARDGGLDGDSGRDYELVCLGIFSYCWRFNIWELKNLVAMFLISCTNDYVKDVAVFLTTSSFSAVARCLKIVAPLSLHRWDSAFYRLILFRFWSSENRRELLKVLALGLVHNYTCFLFLI